MIVGRNDQYLVVSTHDHGAAPEGLPEASCLSGSVAAVTGVRVTRVTRVTQESATAEGAATAGGSEIGLNRCAQLADHGIIQCAH